MKRLNTSFVTSLGIHALVALIVINVHVVQNIKQRPKPSIPVEFNVKAPEPKIEASKPKVEPTELNPGLRLASNIQRSPRQMKITAPQSMAVATAYRNISPTRSSEVPVGLEIAEDSDTQMGKLLSTSIRASGGRRITKGGESQLVQFVDKTKGKRDIVYCMDVSASMGAPGSSKLDLARNYLKDSLLALSDRDRFNIIAFAKDHRIFRSDALVPATKENIADAISFLDEYTYQNVKANTKTDLLAVLIRAFEMKPSIVVIVTDGLPTAGIVQPERIVQIVREKNIGGARIFSIGMEMDPAQPEAWLMKTIAEQNDGEFKFF